MAILYDIATKKITVTGYSEATPCNFTDLYNADKAGTLSLHARVGIAGTDGAGIAVDRSEQPADYLVLGGAANNLYITITNWNGTTSTIRITGTDYFGTAQTEDIVVNANGTYQTTKQFKTITLTQVTAFTATSFDYDLIQGQWGHIWKTGPTQFFTDIHRVNIGDGSTTTWFADENKHITFDIRWVTANAIKMFYIYNHATFRLGKIYDEATKATEDGCQLYFLTSATYYFIILEQLSGGICQLFSTTIKTSSVARETMIRLNGVESPINSKVWNCFLEEGVYFNAIRDIDLYNLTFVRTTSTLRSVATGVTAERISGIGHSYGIYFQGSIDSTIKDVWIRKAPRAVMCNKYHGIGTVINGDFNNWIINWYGTPIPTGTIYRKYTLNLKLMDDNQNDVENATVTLKDKDGTQLFSVTTNASGEIAEQIVAYGYYNQPNGNTLQSSSPHTIEIKKAGYKTYKKKFEMDRKTDWKIAMSKVLDLNFSKRISINNY